MLTFGTAGKFLSLSVHYVLTSLLLDQRISFCPHLVIRYVFFVLRKIRDCSSIISHTYLMLS